MVNDHCKNNTFDKKRNKHEANTNKVEFFWKIKVPFLSRSKYSQNISEKDLPFVNLKTKTGQSVKWIEKV